MATGLLVILAILIARFGWSIPVLSIAEHGVYDLRETITAPRVAPDPRITLVVFDEDTVAQTGKRSPLDRALLASALSRIDAMGPRAIGVDILFDLKLPEDDGLIRDLRALQTPTWLAFATAGGSQSEMQPAQEASLRSFMARLAGSRARPANVALDPDSDGVTRRWPFPRGGVQLASALAGVRPPRPNVAIAYRLPLYADRPFVFSELPIQLFDSPAAEFMASQVRGRFVMIGADLPGVDRFYDPTKVVYHADTTGLRTHAAMLAQALDHRWPAAISRWTLWAAALVVALAGAATGVADLRRWWFWPTLALEVTVLGASPFLVHALGFDTRGLPAIGWLVGWMAAAAAVAAAARSIGAEQRQFAQATLGRYLPSDVAREILRDPKRLTLTGEKREIIALFTDLEGFTKLSHQIDPEHVALIVNRYLDALSAAVFAHGGTLDKFVGDAVVAFWGAPLARPDDAERAVKAAVAVHAAGEALRAAIPDGIPPLGRTRVGLHRGPAIVGNFGGESRIQYTAFGDSMNTASRLESANKDLKTTILVSAAAATGVEVGGFRAMGCVILRGRATPIEVFEAKPDFPSEARTRLNAAYRRFKDGDTAALSELAALAVEFPDDQALGLLVDRLRAAGPDGAFALG